MALTSWVGDGLVVLAAVVYVASAVPLAVLLVRVWRWLLFHRRPELGTRTPDGIVALVLGTVTAALVPLFVLGLIAGDRTWRWLACMLVVMALVNGFFLIMLRESFSVALAELRYTLARRRVLQARAEGRLDPDTEDAARRAEQEYLSTRYWHQER